ncbi:MAG: diguanylate cyclase, partial [Phycisphaerae bacterium]|nr:diguanylate cyclase [Phycisphaerae bacterium]
TSDVQINLGTEDVHVTASFGIAEVSDSPSVEALVKAADEALYHAKQSGRNQVSTDTSPEETAKK